MKEKFIEVEKRYEELKAKLNHGMITAAQMKSELKNMMILDENEKYWMIGGQSGKWYVYEESSWVEKRPSHLKEHNFGILTEDTADHPSYKSITSSSEEPATSVDNNPGVDQKKHTALIEISSLSIRSLILFFGGVGIITGIISGAIFGIFTDILPEAEKFLPQMLKEIRGKVQGGIVFAILGLISGFTVTTLFSIIYGTLFNFLSAFFGGIKFKIKE